MNFRHLLTLTAALLVLPAVAHAETVVQQTTTTTTTTPVYKETTVLKGYKVTTMQPKGSSAPVAGMSYHTNETVFVPVDDMGSMPLHPGVGVVEQHEYKFEKSYKGPTSFNE